MKERSGRGLNEDRCRSDEVYLENDSEGSKWTVAGR